VPDVESLKKVRLHQKIIRTFAAITGDLGTVFAANVADEIAAKHIDQLIDPEDIPRVPAREVLLRSTEAPRLIVYGRARVGGSVTYQNTAGTELRSMHIEVVHTGHEVNDFVGWYLDDKFIPVADVDRLILTNLTDGTYQWTASGSGTSEYYCELSGGGDPSLTEPLVVQELGAVMTEATAGSLAAGEWDWGDNDTLGYSTIYVRLTDSSDPDSQASGFLNSEVGDGGVDADSTGHGFGPAEDGEHYVFLREHLGTDDQSPDSTFSTAFTDIGTTHRHRGCARTNVILVMLEGGEDVTDRLRAVRQINAVIDGKKVYDPRLDSTFSGDVYGAGSGPQRLAQPDTYAFSDDPALCWANYRIDSDLGRGMASTRIDFDSVAVAADYNETTVAVPVSSTEGRFSCNGVLDTSATHTANIRKILSSMGGVEREFNGQFHVYSAAFQTADFTLSDSDLVGPINYRKQPEPDDRFNLVKGSYFDVDRDYKRVPFLQVQDATLLADRDNSRDMPKELRLDMTNGEYMAQRIADRAVQHAGLTGVCSFPTAEQAVDIRIGDRGTLTIEELGWVSKVFRVIRSNDIDYEGIELLLKEDDSTAYADPAEVDYGTRTAAGTIAFPRNLSSSPYVGDSLISDPFFQRSTVLSDGVVAEFPQYHWYAVSGSPVLRRTGGVVGGYAEFDVPSGGGTVELLSLPKDLSAFIWNEQVRINVRVRKTNSVTTLTAGTFRVRLLAYSDKSLTLGVATAGVSVGFAAINGWTNNEWQDFEASVATPPQSAASYAYLAVQVQAFSFDVQSDLEIDACNLTRIT